MMLVPISAESLTCTFEPGDGTGGVEVKVGSQTGSECVKACLQARETDNRINGVTVYKDQREGCFCEKGMTGVNANPIYKTCLFRAGTSGNYLEVHGISCLRVYVCRYLFLLISCFSSSETF